MSNSTSSARIIPHLAEEQLQQLSSAAEAAFYRACRDGLDGRWTVLHSVSWIARQPRRHAQDGEADFLLFHPGSGMLVLEVKGGGIRRDASSGEWFSIDRGMREHHIKDPFAQARRAQHVILDKLREHPEWSRVAPRRVLAGYGVAFPDLQRAEQLSGPERPNAIIATAVELSNIAHWIESAFEWWRNEDPTVAALGSGAAALIERVFARDIRVAPLVSQRLAEEDQKRIELTAQQARLLRALGARRRVAIKGGAGTGKTVLALEKARQLASAGRVRCPNGAADGSATKATERPPSDHRDGRQEIFHTVCGILPVRPTARLIRAPFRFSPFRACGAIFQTACGKSADRRDRTPGSYTGCSS